MLLEEKEVLKVSETQKRVCCCSVESDCQCAEGEFQHWDQCGLERFLSQSHNGLVWVGKNLKDHLFPALPFTRSCFMCEESQVILGA